MGKVLRKGGETCTLFGGLEMWPPQLHSTVSMATQPTAAAAKVEGTWKGLRREESQPYFSSQEKERKWGRRKGRGNEGRWERKRARAKQRNEYEWRNERRREREEKMWERRRGRPMNTGIVPSFLNLIYHIITPRKKNTSIFWRNGDVSMENLGILVHNRSGVKKPKRSKTELPGVWCISELKMDDADYKVFFLLLYSVPCFHCKGDAGLLISELDHYCKQRHEGEWKGEWAHQERASSGLAGFPTIFSSQFQWRYQLGPPHRKTIWKNPSQPSVLKGHLGKMRHSEIRGREVMSGWHHFLIHQIKLRTLLMAQCGSSGVMRRQQAL